MEWTQLVVEKPGFVGGQAVRRFLASHLPPIFFHHAEDGQPLQGPAPVRMFANGYRISILGIGDKGRDLLFGHLKEILNAFKTSPARVATGTFRIYPTKEYRILDVHSCVLKLPVQYTPILASGNYREADKIVSRFVGKHLRKQTELLCPKMCDVVGKMPISAAVYRSVAVDVGGRVLPAVSCLVKIPAKLVGPWQLGALQSRGYGRCRPAREVPCV